MPNVTEQPVRAYAHCRDARCPGYQQQEVDAVRQEKAFTFGELGGDGVFTNMVERSTVSFAFQDPEDAPCPSCGGGREVSGQPRPSYQPLSGHDPMGLLHTPRFDAGAVVPPGLETPVAGLEESDEDIEARLRAKLREEQIEARLRAEMNE